jgi:agmatinase
MLLVCYHVGWLGFILIIALGTDGIIKKIRDRVGTDNPVYLSIDIDTLDPACESCWGVYCGLFCR